MGRHVVFSFLVLLSLTIGCASRVPHLVSDAENRSELREVLGKQYPSTRFIVGYGFSELSEQDALTNSQSIISQSLNSKIQTEIRRILDVDKTNDQNSVSHSIHSETIVTSEFDHGELIKSQTGFLEDSQSFWAFSSISKEELISVLADDYSYQSEWFKTECKLTKHDDLSLPRFSVHYSRSMDYFSELIEIAGQYQAIAKSAHPGFSIDWNMAVKLKNEGALRLSRVRLFLDLERDPEYDTGAIDRKIGSALGNLGLSVETGPCLPGGYLLSLGYEIRWNSVIRPIAHLFLVGTLMECGFSAGSQEVFLNSEEWRGEGLYPVHNLANNTSIESLEAVLKVALERYFPIGGPLN